MTVAQGAEASSMALLLAGADPTIGDWKNQTPLHLAAQAGQQSIVSMLLLRGVDPDAKTHFTQFTALHLAAEEGHAPCVSKLLLGGAEKDSRCGANETPLHRAAYLNHRSAAEVLLKAHASVNVRSFGGQSVVDIAAKRGHVGLLRQLLQHGGDVKDKDHAGMTPLHSAASHERPGDNGDAVRVLLADGADIEAKTTEFGFSPLVIAAYCEFASCGTVFALLEGEADINAVDTSKQTALHMACCRSNVDVVGLLLQWGADETLRDGDGKTAMEVVGDWQDFSGIKETIADDQRIRQILAGTPADRSWLRRNWLLLSRDYPEKVKLTKDSGGVDSSAKVAMVSSNVSGGNGDKIGDDTADLTSLVGRVAC